MVKLGRTRIKIIDNVKTKPKNQKIVAFGR